MMGTVASCLSVSLLACTAGVDIGNPTRSCIAVHCWHRSAMHLCVGLPMSDPRLLLLCVTADWHCTCMHACIIAVFEVVSHECPPFCTCCKA